MKHIVVSMSSLLLRWTNFTKNKNIPVFCPEGFVLDKEIKMRAGFFQYDVGRVWEENRKKIEQALKETKPGTNSPAGIVQLRISV